jgi:hypothetical protein
MGNGVTLTCIRFVVKIRLGVLSGGFLPLGNFGREIFGLLTFFSRVLVCVPTGAGIISCLRMIIRQRFTIGLTLQDFLRFLCLHLFSTYLIVKILGVKLFCSPRFERLAEKDDKQLSRQFLYFLGVCLFWRASDRSIGAGDSTVLRRFAVSVERARRRAGFAELRQFVVLIVFRRASSAELRQYLV